MKQIGDRIRVSSDLWFKKYMYKTYLKNIGIYRTKIKSKNIVTFEPFSSQNTLSFTYKLTGITYTTFKPINNFYT
jgi:hypothetical protein